MTPNSAGSRKARSLQRYSKLHSGSRTGDPAGRVLLADSTRAPSPSSPPMTRTYRFASWIAGTNCCRLRLPHARCRCWHRPERCMTRIAPVITTDPDELCSRVRYAAKSTRVTSALSLRRVHGGHRTRVGLGNNRIAAAVSLQLLLSQFRSQRGEIYGASGSGLITQPGLVNLGSRSVRFGTFHGHEVTGDCRIDQVRMVEMRRVPGAFDPQQCGSWIELQHAWCPGVGDHTIVVTPDDQDGALMLSCCLPLISRRAGKVRKI